MCIPSLVHYTRDVSNTQYYALLYTLITREMFPTHSTMHFCIPNANTKNCTFHLCIELLHFL